MSVFAFKVKTRRNSSVFSLTLPAPLFLLRLVCITLSLQCSHLLLAYPSEIFKRVLLPQLFNCRIQICNTFGIRWNHRSLKQISTRRTGCRRQCYVNTASKDCISLTKHSLCPPPKTTCFFCFSFSFEYQQRRKGYINTGFILLCELQK